MLVKRSVEGSSTPVFNAYQFSTIGAGSFVVPSTIVANSISGTLDGRVILTGGGGSTPSTAGYGSGGGGGAATVYYNIPGGTLTAGATINYFVGGPDQDSWFINSSTALAKAGGPGVLSTDGSTATGPGGAGGSSAASIGTGKYSGGAGGAYSNNTWGVGGSGGGAGSGGVNGSAGAIYGGPFTMAVAPLQAGGAGGNYYKFDLSSGAMNTSASPSGMIARGGPGGANAGFANPGQAGFSYGGGGAGSSNIGAGSSGSQGFIALCYKS